MAHKRDAARRRKRQFDKAIAEARGTLDEIHAMTAAVPRSSAVTDAPNVAALVAREVERQRRAERVAVEAAEVERWRCPDARGGCWTCGLAFCRLLDDSPGWTVTTSGAECVECWNERMIFDRVGDIEDDRRVRTIAHLLGEVGLPLRAVADPHAFRVVRVWFKEFPSAEPVLDDADRWAHVDRQALRAQWDAIASSDGTPVPAPQDRGRRSVRRVRRRRPVRCRRPVGTGSSVRGVRTLPRPYAQLVHQPADSPAGSWRLRRLHGGVAGAGQRHGAAVVGRAPRQATA
jgi:hypothetical protein